MKICFLLLAIVHAIAAIYGGSIDAYFGPASAVDTKGPYSNFMRFIASATNELCICAHELNVVSVADAVAKKKAQGVSVTMFAEKDWLTLPTVIAAHGILKKAGISIIPDRKSGLMHSKFVIADGVRVWTGSMNYTERGFFVNYNDCLWIEDAVIARRYRDHFFVIIDEGKKPVAAVRHESTVGDASVSVYFSPYDQVTRIYQEEIAKARFDIRFLIFAFSSSTIAEAMKSRERNGVRIEGIFDDSFKSAGATGSWKFVPFNDLVSRSGADVVYDDQNAKIHHKQLIIDDRVVITGSFNFSANAEKNNEENSIVIRSRDIGKRYASRFQELNAYFLSNSPAKAYHRLPAANRPDWKVFLSNDNAQNDMRIADCFARSNFSALVLETFSGDVLLVRPEGINAEVTVRLEGVSAPVYKKEGASQEPQASFAKQTLTLAAVKRKADIRVTRQTGKRSCTAMVSADGVSLNELMLASGWCLYRGKADAKLAAAIKMAKSEKLGMWDGQELAQSPEEFAGTHAQSGGEK